jgi:protein gp37/ParB-like chromosome segregation protein Spo0J
VIEFGKYKVHPIANIFPLVEGEEFEKLVAHIKEHKQREPILLAPDGVTIVDGRNRFRACKVAGVTARFRMLPKKTTEHDIIEIIVGANLRRRDLTVGQKTMIGLEIAPALEAAAKERQLSGLKKGKNASVGATLRQRKEIGRVDEQIARVSGVGARSVSKAKKVRDTSKRLAEQVRTGEKSLDEAYKEAKQSSSPPKEQALSKEHVLLALHTGETVKYALPKGEPKFNFSNEQIDWAKWTWNPVTGCLHGCRYCYAREIAEMREGYRPAYPRGFAPLFHHERLDAPANTKVPKEAQQDARLKRVFVCSMADLYGKWVPDEWVERVHASCIANPQWDYLMLTKFPRRYVGLELPPTAWLGTGIDEQKRVRLAEEAFCQIRGVRVKWLSLEPLLAPLQFNDLSMFDWVVIGSQSATRQPQNIEKSGHVAEFAPPFEWVSRIVAQAREAGCKVYLKPNLLGANPNPQCAGMKLPQEEPVLINGKAAEIPEARGRISEEDVKASSSCDRVRK